MDWLLENSANLMREAEIFSYLLAKSRLCLALWPKIWYRNENCLFIKWGGTLDHKITLLLQNVIAPSIASVPSLPLVITFGWKSSRLIAQSIYCSFSHLYPFQYNFWSIEGISSFDWRYVIKCFPQRETFLSASENRGEIAN